MKANILHFSYKIAIPQAVQSRPAIDTICIYIKTEKQNCSINRVITKNSLISMYYFYHFYYFIISTSYNCILYRNHCEME